MKGEKKMKNFIRKAIIEYYNLDEKDPNTEKFINTMTKDEIFDTWCNYEGLINYGYHIRQIIKDIYNIEIK